jgi:uncharacterized membrane protein YqjE
MDLHTSPSRTPQDESIGSLLSGLIGDLQNLIRGEVDLAKTEIREEVGVAMRGAVMLAVAAMLGLTALIVLMFGLATYIEKWVNEWQALGIVGLGLVIVAALAGILGKRRLSASSMTPDRTIESLKEDKEWASQQVKSVRS